MWWYIFFGITGFVLFWFAADASERKAIARRLERFTIRPPSTIDDWHAALPFMRPDAIAEILPLIADGLEIPPDKLLPTDLFERELCIKDRFWCWITDDDSRESIADQIEMRFGHRPVANWQSLADVVLETENFASRIG